MIIRSYRKKRRGLGRQMLSALEEAAKAKGYTTLILDTTSSQTPAQTLFERNGYKETKRTHWKGRGLIYYAKELP
ncbi:hypothetical protein DLM86_12450 [Paenibacillus flagellatus]|uniref:N-acetyltransferase domain-containing protein n=2 Tax=Paenibacillus flagellatus TaxID=2211139 RepID=A0A2V5K8Y2_9BACL|nr:hypothetical protein DLM86_12450 [Paenibacillus flagellatus]